MRLRSPFVPLAVLLAAKLAAQGTVNPSLLAAPAADAATTAGRTTGCAGVVARATPSVVTVFVEIDGPEGKFAIERASSGVIVDPSGLVMTFRHLVAEAKGASDKQVVVQLADAANTKLPATIVRIDDRTGLALLKVTPPADGLTAMPLGPDVATAGEPVVVVARPLGKEVLAFAGVASPALAPVQLGGVRFAPPDVFLCDARNDERCDGAPLVTMDGRLLGLYAAEHVQRPKSDPTLEDLQRPSFGAMVSAGVLRRAFRSEFAAAGKSLLQAPAPTVHAWTKAAAAAAPAVVGVWAGAGDWPALGDLDPGAVQRRDGLGSGVVLGANGLVVANLHVVQGGEPRVRLGDGRTFPAKVVKKSGNTNLALLQVELPAGTVLPVAACAGDDDLTLGETVLALGNPLGGQVVVSAGVVSAMRAREGGRVQADPNLGNQNGGGAIVDVSGRVVGIGDAGPTDPIAMAFAMRGERMTTESNLSTFVGMRRVRQVFAAELAGAAGASQADATLRQTPLTRMVEATRAAMLNIYVAKNVAKVDEDDPFASMKEPELMPLSLGSGVIIDRSGLAISNWHVVDDATNPDGSMRADHVVTARLYDGKTYQVRVLSISRENDLSLLQLELQPGEAVHAVELGDSDALAIGEHVAAIGNPHGRANTITFGIVSAKAQGIRVRGRWAKMEHLLETDAAINGGNSGGALLDMQGRLVGINSAGGGTFNNVGYAIEVDHVRRTLLGLLLSSYKLRSPELGLRVLDEAGKVVVMDVDDRGPAAAAGVKSADRIVALGGQAITWGPGFARTLLACTPGEPVDLEVERQGEAKTFRLVPVAAPVWNVVQQSGLLVRDFPYVEAPERARAAAIGLHRKFTGDQSGEPAVIPESFVVVERVFAGGLTEGADVAASDLLLAVELRNEAGDAVLVRIADVVALRDLFNDYRLGKYVQEGGQVWKTWLARGDEVKKVELRAGRLFW